MKRTLFLFTFLFSNTLVLGQISPTPVANNEIRDNSSVRSRELELERIKRDTNKSSVRNSKETLAKFIEIKTEFENIQKLQVEIIKAYISGQIIKYAQISQSSAELNKKAIKLNESLFNPILTKNQEKKEEKPKPVRDLIIELDKAIGNFVGSSMFSNNKTVDSKISEKAFADLQKIIELSEKLSKEAKKLI